MSWYLTVLKKYAVFRGRASRKEYWMFVLFNIIILAVLMLVEGIAFRGRSNLLASLYQLAILIPGYAVQVRRLHDTNRSGWWSLIGVVPLIGSIVLLVFTVEDSQPEENRYGPNPKAVAAWPTGHNAAVPGDVPSASW